MPRKAHGAKLEKVVSTTITLEDFNGQHTTRYAVATNYNVLPFHTPTAQRILEIMSNYDLHGRLLCL